MKNIENDREFGCINDFKKVVFPNSFEREEKERILKDPKNYGKTIAIEFIKKIKNGIKNE
jgi:hypothetical protein